jgi:hypothetical protein
LIEAVEVGGAGMRYLGLIPVAWAAGVGAYLLALWVFHGQTISQGDLIAVLYLDFRMLF